MLVVWYLLFSFQLLDMIQQTHFNLIGVCNVINTKGSNNTLLLGKTKNSKWTFHFNLHQVYLTQVSPTKVLNICSLNYGKEELFYLSS